MARLKTWFRTIASGIRELSPRCREAVRLQSEAFDRPLALRQRVGLWIHLRLCKWCHRYDQQIRFLRAAAQERNEHLTAAAPEKFSAEATARIKARLRAEK